MNKKLIKSIAFLGLLALSLPLKAQTIFDVEFVFFKRIDRQEGLNYLAMPELEPLESDYSVSRLPLRLPAGYSALEKSDIKLEGVFRRLRSSANLRPMLHFGWRQPLLDKADTEWLSFNLSDDPEQKGLLEFLGALRFSRNQGLLIETHIVGSRHTQPKNVVTELSEDSLDISASEQDLASDSIDSFEDQQRPDELQGDFLLDKSTKVKLNELIYFDHPSMGLLIKVTPYIASFEAQQGLDSQPATSETTENNSDKEQP